MARRSAVEPSTTKTPVDHETRVISDLTSALETIEHDREALERVMNYVGHRFGFNAEVYG